MTLSITTHPDYDNATAELKKTRDCVLGSPFVKNEGYTYLPHPSQIDPNSQEQQIRYKEFKAGAEFPDDTAKTKRTLLGKMRFDDANIKLPDSLEYLEDNVDGDGTDSTTAMESSVGEALETKFHLLVTDYKGLSDVDLQSVSLADIEALDPRATVKQYPRESITNWNFSRIDGAMQLTYLQLLEIGYDFDLDTGTRDKIESYLILALDEDGNYYQQKKIVSGKSEVSEGERSYVTVNGSPLRWLPVQFVADEALNPGCLPRGYGFLHPIADACLSKYNVSAVYKEVQRNLAPTTYTSGWKAGDFEIFQEANGGRSYVATGAGAVNNMPDGVTSQILSVAMSMDDFHWYFNDADKKIQRLGGSQSSDVQMTATEADIVATDQNALLNSIATSCENAWKMSFLYCGMFEGLWSQDNLESNSGEIKVNLPRDFATPRLTVEEVRVLLEMRQARTISEAELQRQLSNGGWLIEDAMKILEELDNESPSMDLPTIGETPQNLTNNTNQQ